MMKQRKKPYYALCLMMGAFMQTGCVEEYEADIAAEDSNLLVVEGTICSGQLNKFSLSRTQALNESAILRMETKAKVAVRGSDGSEYMTQARNGYYTCWIDSLAPEVEYYLHIESDGEVYESVPQKPLRTENIADVTGVQNTPDSNIDVLVTPDVPHDANQTNYYMWTYDETWIVYPDYTTTIYYDTRLKRPVHKENQFPECGWKDATGLTSTIGASNSYEGQHIKKLKIYDVDCSDQRMFYRYSGLVHQRAISKAEYEYELARRQASTEMGGLFTPQPSALPTNIRCLTSRKHVIGYVGCALNTSKYRFFLNAEDFTIHRPPQKDKRIWLDEPSEADCRQMVERGLFLCEWIDIKKSLDGLVHTAWARESQLDVRRNGAYIEEPDFWSSKEDIRQ